MNTKHELDKVSIKKINVHKTDLSEKNQLESLSDFGSACRGTAGPNSPEYRTIVTQIRSELKTHTEIAAAYLLGSAITGQLRHDSDIDIALLPADRQVISMQLCLDLAGLLEARLGKTVDIGIIRSSNLIYASEAILRGQRILTLQKEYTETSEMRLLGCYLVFKEDRKEVERAYRAT